MNPFDLSGPWFLLFFSVMGSLLLTGLVWVRRAWEANPTIPVQLTDPYEIACLRGGYAEVLRLATTGLIDRGLLKVDGTMLTVANPDVAKLIKNSVERAVLEHFWTGATVASMFGRASLRHEGEMFETALQQRGLIADRDARMQQLLTCVGAIGVLWVTAITKIEVAIGRGRSNYGFLIVLTIGFSVGALALALVRKTTRGERFLKDMQTLFDPLKQRASTFKPHANSNELMMMGAVFGLAALPATTYPFVTTVFPKTSSSDGGSSSCGSSSSSSCGSSCGGGGGGCGGCGS